jgi:NDP-sugar pyrophosphorylase family protein
MAVTQCVILLGGLGTRLGDYTRETPKPLLPVAGRPFVDVLVGEALRRGFDDILLLAGYRSEVVERYAADLAARLPEGARVRVSVEPEPLGTGGALTQALHLLDDMRDGKSFT